MEIKKENIIKLIEDTKDDTYINHLKTTFFRDFRPSGEIRQNEVLIWRMNSWNASFYPIFKFSFDTNNTLVKITSKVNPIGKTLIGLLFIGFIYAVVSMISDPNISDNITNLILVGISAIVISIAAGIVYRSEKKNLLEEIFEVLKIDIKPEIEWSIKKFISRLFLYPLSIGFILLSVFLLIPEGEYLLAIILLAIAVTYLYSDIRILIKKNRHKNNF